MSGYAFKSGAQGVMFELQLYDSTKTGSNGGLTGLSSSSAGLIIATRCDNEAAVTAYTQAGGTIQPITTIGTYAAPSAGNIRFGQIDATNAPGLYQVMILNTRLSVGGSKYITITVPAVSGLNLMAMAPLVIPLTDIDPYSRAGLFQAPSVEGYAANGVTTPTPEQMMHMLLGKQQRRSVTGTTESVSNIAQNATVMTFSYNVSGTPTSVSRAS